LAAAARSPSAPFRPAPDFRAVCDRVRCHQRDRLFSADSNAPAAINPNPGAEGAEPEHRSAIAATLRQWLDMQGYRQVHFRIEGTTIILWGRVPNQIEREWVRQQALMFSGATSVVDHIVVQPDPFAGAP
jgi:hypothetical protein